MIRRAAFRVLGITMALAACGSQAGGVAATTLDPVATTTPSLAATTTTTVDRYAVAYAWVVGPFTEALEAFQEWVDLWDGHYLDLNLSEALLDCVEASVSIVEWRELAGTAPDPTMAALVDQLFANWEEAIELCSDSNSTFGDLREAKGLLLESQAIVDRVTDRLNDLRAGA